MQPLEEVTRRRNGLLPSCEPCRKSKQACDHAHPVCGRCARKPGSTERCVYHPAPLTGSSNTESSPNRVRKPPQKACSTPPSLPPPSSPADSSVKPKIRKDIYPDPGYLGSSSSSAVFEEIKGQILIQASTALDGLSKDEAARAELLWESDSCKIKAGVELLTTLCDPDSFDLTNTLITKWQAADLHCSMVYPFFDVCWKSIKTVCQQLRDSNDIKTDTLRLSEQILANTLQPFHIDGDTSFLAFTQQFTGCHLRWEAVGLVFAVIGLAAINLHPTDPMFNCQGQKQQVCKQSLDAADACLACCDPEHPNDVRIWLRFESMILHSLYHGDSSFHTWSKLGDLSSEVFALGLHQELKPGPTVPLFLAELRKRTFAIIYAQDKMLSTYTGRPCRISRKFCVLQMPLDLPDKILILPKEELEPHLANLDSEGWSKSPQDHTAWWARTTTLNSVVRESILELVLGSDNTSTFGTLLDNGNIEDRIRDARKLAEEHWSRMPVSVRYDLLSPAEKNNMPNNMIAGYLEYLYNIFLIERYAVRRLKGSSGVLLNIAFELLKVVLEAINARGKSTFVPGDLAWQVSAYGLPASGILALELLQQARQPTHSSAIPRSETIQNLSVLVSQLPVIIPSGEGNYALFTQARKTLQGILDVVLSPPRVDQLNTPPMTDSLSVASNELPGHYGTDWSWFDQLDFNGDFWNNVADHPLLAPNDVPHGAS